jgi:hypothetical protein
MKCLSRSVIGVLWAGLCTGICAGQAETKPGAGTTEASGKLGRPDAYQYARADDSRHFVVRGMNPGELMVLAFEELQGDYRTPEFAKEYEGKGKKVELDEGGKKSVVVKLITK